MDINEIKKEKVRINILKKRGNMYFYLQTIFSNTITSSIWFK